VIPDTAFLYTLEWVRWSRVLEVDGLLLLGFSVVQRRFLCLMTLH
jgi:hypothetical protein